MHAWRVAYDRKLERLVHAVPTGVGHALLSPIVTTAFQTLRVSASVWAGGHDWFPIHASPSPLDFESEHGHDADRNAYNQRQLAAAVRSKKAERGRHGGYCDLFVPILIRGETAGVVVVGPFLFARPTMASVLESFRSLTGRRAHLTDPQFSAYLRLVLSILVLPREAFKAFESLLECLAGLMSGEGAADEFVNRAQSLQQHLQAVRVADSMWEVVQTMLDERTPLRWYTAARAPDLRRLGLTRRAHHLLVGLTANRREGANPIDEALRRDAFQRRMVSVAQDVGEMLSGQVGDHGVVFLSGATGSLSAQRRKIVEFSERVAAIARKDFGFEVHFGLGAISETRALGRSYQDAVGAAETALGRGTRLEMAEPGTSKAVSLRELREELGRAIDERADVLGPRFDRYLEAVAAHSGYRVDAAQGHLEAGFERLAYPLTNTGALDLKSFRSLCDALDRRAAEARSVSELFAAYRRAIADVSAAIERPVAARQDRSLQSAVDHIHAHYTEPLRLAQVAKVAGFTPSHFSKLFIKRERMSFEHYVRGLRLERAKQLLFDTDLPSTRVAELAGFGSEQYFASVFRAAFGMTPLGYRRQHPMIRHALRNKNKHKNS